VCHISNRCVALRMCKLLDVEFRKSAIRDTALRVFQHVKSPDFEVLDLPMSVLASIIQTSAIGNMSDQR